MPSAARSSSPQSSAAFDALVEALRPDGVREKGIFGKRGLTLGTTSIGCLFGDGLAVKLGAGSADHATGLALPGAELFDPSGRERPFKDWVVVPYGSVAHWEPLARAALRLAT